MASWKIRSLLASMAAATTLLAAADSLRAATAVLVNPSSLPLTGTQAFNFPFGYDFNANVPITISALGIFDNGQNGISTDGTQPVTCTIYNRATQTAISGASLGFGGNSGGDGTLTQGFRFKTLPSPVSLPAGQYSVVTDFYSQTTAENFYNAGGNTNNTIVRDTNSGAITFVGAGRLITTAHNTFPTQLDGGTEPIHYNAGTFVFVPEPTGVALFGLGALGLLGRRRRGR